MIEELDVEILPHRRTRRIGLRCPGNQSTDRRSRSGTVDLGARQGAESWVHRRIECGRRAIEQHVIAEGQILVIAATDSVTVSSTCQYILSIITTQRILATNSVCRGGNSADIDSRAKIRFSIIAKDDVISTIAADGISASAADDHIVTVVAFDGVRSPHIGCNALGEYHLDPGIIYARAIAKYDVLSCVAEQGVVIRTTED